MEPPSRASPLAPPFPARPEESLVAHVGRIASEEPPDLVNGLIVFAAKVQFRLQFAG